MICQPPSDRDLRCVLMLQDDKGAVASYNNALIHTIMTADGLMSITVKDSADGWVRERPQGIVERDLAARIEAAIAVLDRREPNVGQAIKILKGKI